MKPRRLNKTHRAMILGALMRHKFGHEAKEIIRYRGYLAKFIYDDIYSPLTQERMNKLDPGWLPEDSHVEVHIGHETRNFHFNGKEHYSYVNQWLEDLAWGTDNGNINRPDAIFYRFQKRHYDRAAKSYAMDHPVATLRDTLENDLSDLRDRYNELHAKTQAALNRYHSVDKLVKEWPEVQPFVPAAAWQERALPVINVTELNASLGITVEAPNASS